MTGDGAVGTAPNAEAVMKDGWMPLKSDINAVFQLHLGPTSRQDSGYRSTGIFCRSR